ncbi:MAG: hypothetical protein AVDCRST_MAG88-1266, partial [uncultured Thermomicrobiales bacterium]
CGCRCSSPWSPSEWPWSPCEWPWSPCSRAGPCADGRPGAAVACDPCGSSAVTR